MTTQTSEPRLMDKAIASTLPLMPRRLVQRFSAPYIAGETLADALATADRLAGEGFGVTVDVLGEAITLKAQAEATRDAYLNTLNALARSTRGDVLNVSVKLTALGLSFDFDLALSLTREIVELSQRLGGFTRIDMEDTPYTDQTLQIFRTLREEGFENVGIVVQSYLRRTADDIKALVDLKPRVRIVKGIYIEPPELAFQSGERINQCYVELSRTLIEAGCHVAWATHDEELIKATAGLVEEYGIGADRYEYQMLLGVREDLRDQVLAQGHPLRVYVPFGARWYEYSMRRLRENPRVAGHVAADVFGRIFRLRGR